MKKPILTSELYAPQTICWWKYATNRASFVSGLLGPRFPHLLKLLSLAKTEVHWLLRHEANVPTKKPDLQILTGGLVRVTSTIYLANKIAQEGGAGHSGQFCKKVPTYFFQTKNIILLFCTNFWVFH